MTQPEQPARADGITFLLTGEGEPEPFLAYEADTVMLEIPAGSPDPIDALVNLYLEKGFELVTGPLLTQPFPTVPGWTLKADDQGVTLWDDFGVIALTVQPWKGADEWVEFVRQRGWARVITGSDLGIRNDDLFGTIDSAITGGRVVGATVEATTEDLRHPSL